MTVKHGIMGLLSQKPRYGYELRSAFVTLMGGEGSWDVKPAQIYSTLGRLEKAGQVKAKARGNAKNPEKQVFFITSAGRKELERWFTETSPPDRQRDDAYLKMVLGLATGLADPQAILSRERAALYQTLHTVTARRQLADPKRELALILLLDKTVMHLEADLRWLDMVEVRLEEVRSQPIPEPDLRPRGRPKKTK